MKHLLYFLFIIILSSCTEEYRINIFDNTPKLVVECALLDIDSIHYVKLSLSKSSFTKIDIDTTAFGIINKFQPVTAAIQREKKVIDN